MKNIKYIYLFLQSIICVLLISCSDSTEKTIDNECKENCEPVVCSDGLFANSQNICINPCENINCGDGLCVPLSAYKTKCNPPECESGMFLNGENKCVNPCENIDCGNEAICEGKSAYSFECVVNCSENYIEDNNICVNPCANVDCGLGVSNCVVDSATQKHCECETGYVLVNDKCRIPFKPIQFESESFVYPEAEGFVDPENTDNATHTPHHNGYDMFFNENEEQYIDGNFEYGDFRVDLSNEAIAIYVYSYTDENPQWKHLIDLSTDIDGIIHYDIPNDKKFPVGNHLIKLLVKGDLTEANMYIKVFKATEPLKLVVFDMDGTLTTADSEITWDYLNELWNGDVNDSEMYPGAPEVATYYYQRGYNILYLTARPYWLSEKSYQWLVLKNFPFGLLHTYEGATPDGNFDAAGFKKAYLQSLIDKGIEFSFTYGNALTDIEAYKFIGKPCDEIFIIGEHAGKECVNAVANYVYHLTTLPK